MNIRTAAFLAATVLSGAMGLSAADVLVVNASVPDLEASADAIRDIFLGKKNSWSDESAVVLATRTAGGLHERFLADRIGKSPRQFLAYWRRLLFTGKARLPAAFDDEAELLAFVAQKPGAIGYIDDGFWIIPSKPRPKPEGVEEAPPPPPPPPPPPVLDKDGKPIERKPLPENLKILYLATPTEKDAATPAETKTG